MSTHSMMFPSEWSERMVYERAKAGYWPYDIEDLRHFCALRDLRIEELEADNAKLRELVRDMWRFTGAACKKYPRLFDPAAAGGQMVQLNMIDSFEQRMRELRVEVDDD